MKKENKIIVIPTNKSNIWGYDDGTLDLLDREATSSGIECPVHIYECEYIGLLNDGLGVKYNPWNFIFETLYGTKFLYGNNLPTDWKDGNINYTIYNILRTTNPDFHLVNDEKKIPTEEVPSIIRFYNQVYVYDSGSCSTS
jgi:hypothetical protein